MWPLGAEVLAVRQDRAGWLSGLAVRTTRVRVLPGDLDAEVVDDDAALREIVAGELVALAGPILTAVQQRAPFGVPRMWGNFVDELPARKRLVNLR